MVQAVTDAATELTTAEFGAFFYNVVNEQRRVVHAVHDFGRAARGLLAVSDAAQYRGVRADVQRDRRGAECRHHEGPALRTQRAPSRDAPWPPAGAKLSGRAGQGSVGRRDRRIVLRPLQRRIVSREQHERLAVGVASWASVALENARMYMSVQEASRIKDDFLASLSHELRTPLNAILGYARMLRTGIVAPEKREKAIETIERNATSLTQIVEDVLDISRIVVRQDSPERSARRVSGDRSQRRRRHHPGGRRQGRSDRDRARSAGRARVGGSGTPAAGVVESALECGEVHEPRRQGAGPARARQFAPGSRGQRHGNRHSHPSSCRMCSSDSARRTPGSPASEAVSAWAFPSPVSWSRCTAARSTSRAAALARARRSD